jgi:hypothetical protein
MSFPVSKRCCSECLFSNNKVVSDPAKREILAECAQHDTHFICHKATAKGQDICCRGFYDQNHDATQLMRIARLLGAIRFVDVE